jgi:alkanesulfonate monooxygenase SsuD/methylene tetrahydromethanopterin reductase-like flavin-dependent oxidoreductase (luciferase family)
VTAEQLAPRRRVAITRHKLGYPAPLVPAEPLTALEPDLLAALRALDTSADITGSPESVRDQLAELVDRTGADEVMVLTNTYDVTDRSACYERLATVMTDL